MVVVMESINPFLIYWICTRKYRSADVQENRDARYDYQLFHHHDVVGAAVVSGCSCVAGRVCLASPTGSAPRASRCRGHGPGGGSDRNQPGAALAESSLRGSAPAASCGSTVGIQPVSSVLSTACPYSCRSPEQSAPSALPPDTGRIHDNRWVSAARFVLPLSVLTALPAPKSPSDETNLMSRIPIRTKNTGTCRPGFSALH